jgi:hypothetical protein
VDQVHNAMYWVHGHRSTSPLNFIKHVPLKTRSTIQIRSAKGYVFLLISVLGSNINGSRRLIGICWHGQQGVWAVAHQRRVGTVLRGGSLDKISSHRGGRARETHPGILRPMGSFGAGRASVRWSWQPSTLALVPYSDPLGPRQG